VINADLLAFLKATRQAVALTSDERRTIDGEAGFSPA
jgi:hypothetical protein